MFVKIDGGGQVWRGGFEQWQEIVEFKESHAVQEKEKLAQLETRLATT